MSNEKAEPFNVEAPDGTKTYMSNANFHYFENGKFKRVYVYMSGGENTLRQSMGGRQ